MKFGKSSLVPSYSRKPDFRTSKSHASAYEFFCIQCRTSNTIEYDRIIKAVSLWEEEWKAACVTDAKDHFRIGVVGKSQDGGWPSMVIVACEACGAEHLIYAGVNEVSNSMYTVIIQGVTEILDR